MHLFRTPMATDGTKGGPNQRDSSGGLMLSGQVAHLFKTPMSGPWLSEDGKDYGPAVSRWERVTGRPAPSPTELGEKVARRLSRHFEEWLMGLPAGWVTDVPGLTRTETMTVLGNGVVPQQAEAAFRHLLEEQT